MTTALLIIIVLVDLARLWLQYRSGKTYAERQEKTYCTASEVENLRIKVKEDDINNYLDKYGKMGYEFVCATYSGFNKTLNYHSYTLFFTRKKIKNYTEE